MKFALTNPVKVPSDIRETALVCTAALLLAIWPLPGTMLLRNLALLIGAFLGGAQIMQFVRGGADLKRFWPAALLMSFFPWLLWRILAWPTLVDEQWYELGGDWARAFCASITGLGLGLLLSRHHLHPTSREKCHSTALLLGLSGTVLIYAARYLYEVYQTGILMHHNFYEQPFAGKTASVVFGGLFLIALCVRLQDMLQAGQFNWRAGIYALAILLVLANFYFANTKNGFIVFFACTLMFFWGLLRSKQANGLRDSKRVLGVLLIASLVLVAFAAHWRANPAWSNMLSNVRLCADIEGQNFWKNQDTFAPPVSASGKTFDISTCQRVAWAHAGLVLIGENPGGFGLINHSFGALAIQRWDGFIEPLGKRRGATHSGLIDFTLGFGVLGLVLVLVPLAVAFQRAGNRSGFWYRYTRWTVPVLLLAYLVTEVSTGHFIELLFFLTATFSTLCSTEQGTNATPQPT